MNKPDLEKSVLAPVPDTILVGTVAGVIVGLVAESVTLSISAKVAFDAPKKLAPKLSTIETFLSSFRTAICVPCTPLRIDDKESVPKDLKSLTSI